MRYTIVWDRAATEGLRRLRQRDGEKAVRPLTKAVNDLAKNPEPPESTKLGSTGIRRLRVGIYRATYEIQGATIAVKILMVGSTAV
ncbi:type II toxin-antitoxin system RelE/ParE family toxin [Streptomyces sp. B1866]|uniref:type II toxin-antitoxin system RelE family toxin n=1 Tax=Streptomyces sp. B1866 TaxID=3075431 RepID=UPI00288E0ACC|nr:type II toxin-antitoxin system RelE/ParE family toxin [Streptomyces sp. B1866]MDT3396611.1 type II toxin-antitoxin system RelE/ParE family toxin [Streptomyces sp. B1866]